MIRALVIALLLAPVSSGAKEALIISGGADIFSNRKRYETISREAWNGLKDLGYKPDVISQEKPWKFIPPEHHRPADSFWTVEKELKRKLQTDKSTILFITNHGSKAEKADPLDSGFYLFNQGDRVALHDVEHKVKHSEIRDVVKRNLPPGSSLKMIGVHCYAGGLHSISRQVPGVCSIGATDFRSPTLSELDHNPFSRALFRQASQNVAEGKSTNLRGLFYSTLKRDPNNYFRGNLSSQDFVNFVTKSGPYDASNVKKGIQTFNFDIDGRTPELGYFHFTLSNCLEGNRYYRNLSSIVQNVERTWPDHRLAPLKSHAPDIFERYQEAKRYWHSEFAGVWRRVQALGAKIGRETTAFNTLSPSEQKRQNAAFRKHIEGIKNQILRESEPLVDMQLAILEANRTLRFLGIANEEQLKTFERLRVCEEEAL